MNINDEQVQSAIYNLIKQVSEIEQRKTWDRNENAYVEMKYTFIDSELIERAKEVLEMIK